MKRSIFFKNFVVTVCMFVTCSLILGIAMFFMGRAFLIREKQDGLHSSAREVRRYAEAVRIREGGLFSWDLRMNMTAIAQSTGNHILICDNGGMVLTSSDFSPISPYYGEVVDPAIIEYIRHYESYEYVGDLSGIYEDSSYILGVPIRGWNERTDGYVFVAYRLTEILQTWKNFIAVYTLIAVVVLAAAVAFSYINSRRISRPLDEMSAAAHRYALGDYSVRVTPTGQEDEVGAQIDAFNVMAEGLERNESLRREFVANISHELRTPMTTISGFADGILDGTIPGDKAPKYLEAISSETKRLSRLVRSMLDMSRLRDGAEENKNACFDLNETVVRTILNFEERVNEKGLQIDLQMPETAISVRGDVDALTRVVYNLMDNAVKFSRPGGVLSVAIWKENGRAYTGIRNEGPDIPSEELPRIFDRFHKTDRSRSKDRDGVGLGLYMVRELLAAYEQDVFVTSADGITTFTFTTALAEE